MKRSANVMLTLLVPAMSAFGCGRQPPPLVPQHANQPANQQVAADCQVPAKPGEPEKPPCPPPDTTTSQGNGSTHGSYYRGRSVFAPVFGGSRSVPTTPLHGTTSSSHITTPNHTSGSSHPTASSHPTTSHTSSASHVSRGGFGSSGAHASGGS